MSANLKTVKSFSFYISNVGSGLYPSSATKSCVNGTKALWGSIPNLLNVPSTKVCIRTFTLAEVSKTIHACSQVPGGFASEETVEHPSFYPRAGITFTTADFLYVIQLRLFCSGHGRIQP